LIDRAVVLHHQPNVNTAVILAAEVHRSVDAERYDMEVDGGGPPE
jgi:hypothetical protein